MNGSVTDASRGDDEMPEHQGLEDLEREVHEGTIDTVLCATPDTWGRLMGKRLTGESFLETALADEGLHGSLYLFVVDMDMDPRPGYAISNWETGFSDFRFVPDLSTLRRVPWLDRTAVVICDPYHEDSDDIVEISPRVLLRRQVEAAREMGLTFKCASELEFYLFRHRPEEAWQKRYQGLEPLSLYRADYHILQSTKDEWIIRQIRNQMNDARIEVEFSKAEWGLGQHEVNLRYVDALEMADRHLLYKNGVKEIAAHNGLTATFMAKPSIDEVGSSFHIHMSMWDMEAARSVMCDAEAPHHMSELFRHALGGQLETARELTWMSAPNVNSYKRFLPDSFAPTAITWGLDNRTCGFRVVGKRDSLRVENRIPGADANAYLAFAATIMASLHGIENKIDCGDPYIGNAYEATDVERVPNTLHEAVEEFERSSVGKAALGDEVFDHLINFARQEQLAFENEAVTDWERIRYFERV